MRAVLAASFKSPFGSSIAVVVEARDLTIKGLVESSLFGVHARLEYQRLVAHELPIRKNHRQFGALAYCKKLSTELPWSPSFNAQSCCIVSMNGPLFISVTCLCVD